MRLLQTCIIATTLTCCAFGQATSTISTFAGIPAAGTGYSGDGGQATAAQLFAPTGVAVDSAGNVYIADTQNSVIRKVGVNGVISTVAGNGIAGFTGDGVATAVSLNQPNGVAVDSAGILYIADSANNRIRRVSAGVITTIAGAAGGFSGDGGAAISAALNFPASVAVDGGGNIYIADTANHRIRKISAGNISTVAGNSQIGFSGDNVGATLTALFSPRGVAVDPQGNIFIADSLNHRIRKVSAGIITTVAGIGTAGYSGDGGSALAARLNTPRGVAIDVNGIVYIADTFNNVIRRVANGAITTSAGTGVSGFGGDGGSATSALLNAPGGVALDPTGGFTYIADTNNSAVRLINNSGVSGVIPHFAAGSTYVTGLYVINTSSQPAIFAINFLDNSGNVLRVPFSGGSTTTSGALTDTIPGFGTGYYEAGSVTSATQISGSGLIQSSPSIVVQTLIRHSGPAGTLYEASVPSSKGSFEFEIAFDATTLNGTQIYTGIAITNIDGANSATVTCVARDNLGVVIPNAVNPPVLFPQGHWAEYNFPALLGKRGTLDCTSTTRIGAIALRFLGVDALSTLPVILK